MDRVRIRFCGNGHLGFRPDGGSLWKSPKVTKGLMPHHSAPRQCSVCPNAGLNPWAAAMGHPWPSAANPASCRVTHGFKPAFGQRGLTGRLRSRSKARSRAARFASWLRLGATQVCRYLWLSGASPLPHFLPCPLKGSDYFMLVNANFTPIAINTAPMVRSNQCPIFANPARTRCWLNSMATRQNHSAVATARYTP
ncbi:hypothetical protein [Pseudomonas sp. 44 R 15]|nr:hypothetical protein [Pseudomonas sp. 44 R 15]